MLKQIVIVTPALADANNGNWQTARRWAGFLSGVARVRLVKSWPDADAAGDNAMIALHARRSADSIAAWHASRGAGGLAVVLTGTDLYGDIAVDAAAQRSLHVAGRLVVLQELGINALPAVHRHKAGVIYQSVTARRPLAKTPRHLRALMVGHLRAEKDPATLFAAAHLLADRGDILIDHIGGPLDPALAEQARATMAACPNFRWLGAQPYPETRVRIQRAHVLVHCSRMEGGAHVVMEAAASGTPVLASCIDGNVGMLGADYGGYFPAGDAGALAGLLVEARETQAGSRDLLSRLSAQCARRVPLFAPEAERAAAQGLAAALLAAI